MYNVVYVVVLDSDTNWKHSSAPQEKEKLGNNFVLIY